MLMPRGGVTVRGMYHGCSRNKVAMSISDHKPRYNMLQHATSGLIKVLGLLNTMLDLCHAQWYRLVCMASVV